jgi:dihydroorotate dehydrogenase
VGAGKKKGNRSSSISYQQTQRKIPIIASGGIFTGTDAKEKLNAGAELIQVWDRIYL